MRTGIFLSYAGGFRETVEHVVELEKQGVNIVLVAEAYSFDAVSQLGYLAAKTSTIELGSGVVPIYTRTPTSLAMSSTLTRPSLRCCMSDRAALTSTGMRSDPTGSSTFWTSRGLRGRP